MCVGCLNHKCDKKNPVFDFKCNLEKNQINVTVKDGSEKGRKKGHDDVLSNGHVIAIQCYLAQMFACMFINTP